MVDIPLKGGEEVIDISSGLNCSAALTSIKSQKKNFFNLFLKIWEIYTVGVNFQKIRKLDCFPEFLNLLKYV